MKSVAGKEKWRNFIGKFNKLDDFGYGTLVRIYSDRPFGEDNSILVVRIQFIAIEIARNREGYNDVIFEKHKKIKSDV